MIKKLPYKFKEKFFFYVTAGEYIAKNLYFLTLLPFQRWKDQLLYWDPNKFEGLNEIVLPLEMVWIPDTILYNS